jgi:hypothetical protein
LKREKRLLRLNVATLTIFIPPSARLVELVLDLKLLVHLFPPILEWVLMQTIEAVHIANSYAMSGPSLTVLFFC